MSMGKILVLTGGFSLALLILGHRFKHTVIERDEFGFTLSCVSAYLAVVFGSMGLFATLLWSAIIYLV